MIFTASIFIGVIHGLLNSASTIIYKEFIDSVGVAAYNGKNINTVVFYIGLLFVLSAISGYLHGLVEWFGGLIDVKIDETYPILLSNKCGKLSFEHFENNELYNRIDRAKSSSYSAWYIMTSSSVIILLIIQLIVTGTYITFLHPLLLGILLLSLIPAIIATVIKGRRSYAFQKYRSPKEREQRYIESCITSIEYSKETRTNGLVMHFISKWCRIIEDIFTEENKMRKKNIKVSAVVQLLYNSCYIVCIVLAIILLYNKEITIGSFGFVIFSVQNLQSAIRQLINRFGEIYSNALIMSYLFEFLNIDEQNRGNRIVLDTTPGIQIKNLYYHYPYSDNMVLKDINLNIKAGEKIAIVGENGAGKTTLAKVILSLLSPTCGEICLNGINYSEYKDLETVFTCVQQNFNKYLLTLRENIGISDYNKIQSYEEVICALSRVGLNEYAGQIDAMVGRDFGGIEFSGGQWQRIAIARGDFKSASVLVLDEPTAAIDPLQEAELYTKFTEMAVNKTTIIITHRLGLSRFADTIIVMDNGEIIEKGTHS